MVRDVHGHSAQLGALHYRRNLALDENGKPNIGPFSCGGVVTINSKTKEITRSGQYWAFAHYSKAIRRGARRIDSQGTVAQVSHVGCANPDGSYVLVLTNGEPDTEVRVRMAGMMTEVAIPERSIVTLAWS